METVPPPSPREFDNLLACGFLGYPPGPPPLGDLQGDFQGNLLGIHWGRSPRWILEETPEGTPRVFTRRSAMGSPR